MRNFLLILSFLIGASTFAQVNHTDQKGLKQGKWVKILGWEGPEAARQEVQDGLNNYKKAKG